MTIETRGREPGASPAVTGYVLPLKLERRDETGTSSGLVGVGGDSNNKLTTLNDY